VGIGENDEYANSRVHGDDATQYEGFVLRDEADASNAFLADFSAMADLAVHPDQLEDVGHHPSKP